MIAIASRAAPLVAACIALTLILTGATAQRLPAPPVATPDEAAARSPDHESQDNKALVIMLRRRRPSSAPAIDLMRTPRALCRN
jgi:hypothetical protein